MDQLTSVQLSEWEAYDRLDPIGTWRDDFRTALLASIVTNVAMGMAGVKGKMTKPLDFMPNWNGEEVETAVTAQTPDDILNVFKNIISVQNKKKKGIQPKTSDTETKK